VDRPGKRIPVVACIYLNRSIMKPTVAIPRHAVDSDRLLQARLISGYLCHSPNGFIDRQLLRNGLKRFLNGLKLKYEATGSFEKNNSDPG
jgi:hypothetical protein